MFMGTRNVPNGQFDAIMEAEGGSNNASTSEDRTNYFEVGPSRLLETFLWLEADRLSSLADDMTKQKLDLQRDVVKNERRQVVENRPYGRVDEVLPQHAWPDGHPYHHPVIGSHADLSAASVADVTAFFRRYYVPSNASLVIAGDFRRDDARRLVERYFAWMPRAPEPEHVVPPPARIARDERVVLHDQVALPQVTLVWSSPEADAPGDADCEVLAALLGGGHSSRLQRALVYQRKLAQEIEVEQRANRWGGNFVITATAQAGHTAAELERAIADEVARLRRELPTEREFARARAVTETRKLQELAAPTMLADTLNELEFRFGDPGQLERSLLARYEAVTASDVAWQADAMLGRAKVTIEVLPKVAR
jgi:zinc protease